jgi:hypothetical protein
VTLAALRSTTPTDREAAAHAEASAGPLPGRRSVLAIVLETSRTQRGWLYPSLVPALVTLALGIYMLSLPNVLFGTNQYDDGVYMASALRLTHGVLPYRDFVIVHPPGILILMAPVALVGRLLGSNVAFALGRELTIVIASLNVMLAAAVVRNRGWKVSLLAASALALFPMVPAADSTVFLEPYLVFFCLLGFLLLFSKGSVSSRSRCLLAGLCFGFAGTVKIWAAVILLTAFAVCLRRAREAVVPLLLGTLAGFALPCLPFFATAPHAFIRDVLGDQFSRAVSGGAAVTWLGRLSNLTGLNGITVFRAPGLAVLAVATSAVGALSVVFFRCRRSLAPVDTAIFIAGIAAAVTLCLPHEMYAHYVYFSAPFLSMALAISVGEIVDRITPSRTMSLRSGATVVIGGCVVAATFLVPQQAGYARSHLISAKDPTFLNLFVPPNACILTDDVSLLVSADLFQSSRPGCPPITDAFGTWLSDGPKEEPAYSGTAKFGSSVQGPFSSHFTNEWATWLSKADYVVSLAQYSGYIPWNDQLASWFNSNFHAIHSQPHLWIYERAARTPAPIVG